MSLGKVVVQVTPTFSHRIDGGMVAAHFEELGLTAYGDSEAMALGALKRLLRAHIGFLRTDGLLEKTLNLTGVDWNPLAEFKETGDEYEDLTMPERDWQSQKPLPVAA